MAMLQGVGNHECFNDQLYKFNINIFMLLP